MLTYANRRRHLSLVPECEAAREERRCSAPGCGARAQAGSATCAACTLAERVDLDALAPVLAQFDDILGPVGGLSSALRDRIALVAAVWLHDHGAPQGGEADLAQALGHGLLSAAITARSAPQVMP